MFSGIVEKLCPVVGLEKKQNFITYALDLPDQEDLKIGDSVSVDGVCQTVVKIDQNRVFFDAMEETLSCTTLKSLSVGQMVNIEKALRYGDRVGGHLVSGHVMATGTVQKLFQTSNNLEMSILVPEKIAKYLFPKGFIAIDGASLTIGKVEKELFSVHLIPETLRVTTLGSKKVGDLVNIEIDSQTQVIVDTLQRSNF